MGSSLNTGNLTDRISPNGGHGAYGEAIREMKDF